MAVWGPNGAPGRSTVAMGIADRASADGRSVLLIDADIYGGVLATAFGLLDESAGLAGMCRLATTGRLDLAGFAGLCWAIDARLTLLTGIARADRWPEVRASTMPMILELARQVADLVVIDCAALLEADEEVSFDTMAPRRNGATLAVLDRADVVVAVGSADPPGVERLVRGLAELGEVLGARKPAVVFNRVRDTAAAPAELTAALRRFTGLTPTAFLPEDRPACDEAWRRGVTLSAAAARSPLTRAFGALVHSVASASAAARS